MASLNKLRSDMAQRFLESLTQGQLPWKACWQGARPINAVTGKQYRGVNAMYLSYVAENMGYTDPRWCTYNQAKEKGWQVRKGAASVAKVEYWAYYDRKQKKLLSWEEAGKLLDADPAYESNLQISSRTYPVFNAAQIDGIPALERNATDIGKIRAQRDALIRNMGIGYQEYGTRAYYSPALDSVTLPPEASFDDTYSYMATFLHECGHASGHHTRLNRDLSGFHGSEGYAREELRAEIASAFTVQALGLQLDNNQLEYHLKQHTAYIQSWASVLQKNPEELFRAIKSAEEISDYLIEKGELNMGKEQSAPAQTEWHIVYKNLADMDCELEIVRDSDLRGRKVLQTVLCANAQEATEFLNRYDYLDRCFMEETDDPETQEWREDLTAGEAALVEQWDHNTAQGFSMLASAILERSAPTKRMQTVPETPKEAPVGRIDYYGSNGRVRESIEYNNENDFIAAVKQDNYYGVPMGITVYSDPATGKHMDTSWRLELDSPPLAFSVEPRPAEQIMIAIESTDDYTDANFHQESTDIDKQNPDGSWGTVVDQYRLVKIGSSGCIEVLDADLVFSSKSAAKAAATSIPYEKLVPYDELVREAGKNLTAKFALEELADGSGLQLRFQGHGTIEGYISTSARPWQSQIGRIKEIVIEDGITNIGRNILNDFPAVEKITWPRSIRQSDPFALRNCPELKEIAINGASPHRVMVENITSPYELLKLANRYPELTREQLSEVAAGFRDGASWEQVAVYAKPDFSPLQMNSIRYSFSVGLTPDQIALHANPTFDAVQMDIIRTGFQYGMTMEQVQTFAKPELTAYQMLDALTAFRNGRSWEPPVFSPVSDEEIALQHAADDAEKDFWAMDAFLKKGGDIAELADHYEQDLGDYEP